MTNNKGFVWFLGLFVFIILSACSPIITSDQVDTDHFEDLSVNQIIGQTFQPRFRGLNGVDVYLTPGTQSEGTIELVILEDPDSGIELAKSILSVESIDASRFYRFSFDISPSPELGQYYFFLRYQGGDAHVTIGAAPPDRYLQGALYRNHEPQDSQLAFRLSYNPWLAFQGLIFETMDWLGKILIACFLFLIPGFAILTINNNWLNKLDRLGKTGVAAGFSLSLYPLLFLWTDVFGLHLGKVYAWLPGLLGLAYLLIKMFRHSNFRGVKIQSLIKFDDSFWVDLSLWFVVLLIIGSRFYIIRNLNYPLWGDSYHHTVITQLIVNNGGLFDSWLPFAELQTFTYHFGFHTWAAVFQWITHLPSQEAVLWLGQIINIIAVTTIYSFVLELTRNRWAGIIALIVGGLLSPMPMYYVNWGRYTQLAGQALLPVFMLLSWDVIINKDMSLKKSFFLVLVGGGLALTHYRVLIFGLVFVLTLLIGRKRQPAIKRSCLIVLGIGILVFPWMINVFQGYLGIILVKFLSTPRALTSSAIQEYNQLKDILTYLPGYLVGLCLLSILVALWKRSKQVIYVTAWTLLLILMANPQWIGLPGAGILSNFAVFIAIYIPAAMIISFGFDMIQRTTLFQRGWLLFGLLMIVSFTGFAQTIDSLRVKEHALVTFPDIKAGKWLRDNTPSDAIFLANAFFAYGDSVVVGADAGWWLPILAGRKATVPPVNYGSEQGTSPDYIQRINSLENEVINKGVTNPEVIQLLRDEGIRYVYIGQRQGRVNNPGYALNPEELLSSGKFNQIYHEDLVYVFALK